MKEVEEKKVEEKKVEEKKVEEKKEKTVIDPKLQEEMRQAELSYAGIFDKEFRRFHTNMSIQDQIWFVKECKRLSNNYNYNVARRNSPDNLVRAFLIADKNIPPEKVMAMTSKDMTGDEFKAYFQEFVDKYGNPNKAPEDNMKAFADMKGRFYRNIMNMPIPDPGKPVTIEKLNNIKTFIRVFENLEIDLEQDYEAFEASKADSKLKKLYNEGIAKEEGNIVDRAKFMLVGQVVLPMGDYVFSDNYTNETKANSVYCMNEFFSKYGGKKLGEVDLKDFSKYTALNPAITGTAQRSVNADGKPKNLKENPVFADYMNGKTNVLPLNSNLHQMFNSLEPTMRDVSTGDIRNNSEEYLKNGLEEYSDVFDKITVNTPDLLSLPQEKQDEMSLAYYSTLSKVYSPYNLSHMAAMAKDEFDLFRTADGKTIRQYVDEKYPNRTTAEKKQAMVLETMRQAFEGGVVASYYTIDKDYNYHLQKGIKIKAVSEMELDEKEIPEYEEKLSRTQKARENLFTNQEGKKLANVSEMSDEQLENAAKMFDDIFAPLMNRDAVKDYKDSHPSWNEWDIFKFGGRNFRDYIGKEKFDRIQIDERDRNQVKAELIRLATDPAAPLSLSLVRHDQVKDKYTFLDPMPVMTVENKGRILNEKPYLKDMKTYKEYLKAQSSIDVSSYNAQDLNDLYQEEFRSSAEGGLISAEDIFDTNDLVAETNPDIPAQLSMQNIFSVYGARPKFIKSFVGNEKGEGRVYTADQFKNYLEPLDSGSFSNEEFGLISYLASLDPDVIEGDVYPEAGMLSDADKVMLKSSEWTTALKNGNTNIGDKYLATVIDPARKSAAEAIELYEDPQDNNPTALAGTIAIGLSSLLNTMRTTDDLMEPNGVFAVNGHIIKDTLAMLDEREDLREEVNSRLTPDEVELLDGIVKLTELHDKKQEALQAITDHQNGYNELENEELDEKIAEVANFDYFAEKWNDNIRSKKAFLAEHDKEYQNLRKKMLQAASNSKLNSVERMQMAEDARADLLRYENESVNPDKELLDALNSDDPTYEMGKNAGADIREIKEHFDKYLKQYIEAHKIKSREKRGVYPEDITPEISFKAQKDKVEAEYMLKQALTDIANSMGEEACKKVFEKYNEIKKSSGQKERKYMYGLGGFFTISEAVQGDNTFMDVLYNEMQKNPLCMEKYGNLKDKITGTVTPDKQNIERLLVYPSQERINDLKATNNSPEAQELLDRVNRNLAQRSEASYGFLKEYEDPERINAIIEGRAGNSTEKYADGVFGTYNDIFKSKEYNIGDLVEIDYSSKPDLVENLKTKPPGMSEDSKTKVIEIMKKIKENGFVNKDSAIEQGTKIYVHEVLLKSKEELKKAVESGKIEDIRKANEKYEAEKAKMQEVFDLTEKHLGGTILAPGNINTLRNADIPPEFSTHVNLESKVNGLYQTACLCEKLGITPEEFIDNPGQHLLDYVQKSLEEKGFNTVNKIPGKTGLVSSYRALYEKGIQIELKQSVGTDIGIPDANMITSRTISGYALYESDPEKLLDIERYQTVLGTQANNMISNENIYEKLIYSAINGDEVDEQILEQLKTGLKAAFIEGGNIEKKHLPLEQVDYNGNLVQKPNLNDVYKEKNKYKGILDNYHKGLDELNEIETFNKDKNREFTIKTSFLKNCMEESMFDYLMAHPEDSMKPEYKELEKEALEAHKKLGIKDPAKSQIAEKYKTWKKDYNAEMNTLYSNAKEKDLAVNKQINRLQKQLKNLSRTIGSEAADQFSKKADAYQEIIDERLKELTYEYKTHKITEHYFINRVENLLQVKNSFNTPVNDPPKFLDSNDPETFAIDSQMINDRLINKTSEHYLDSLDNFKKWKFKQKGMELLEESDLSAEEWKSLYYNEIERSTEGISLPNGYEMTAEHDSLVNEKDKMKGLDGSEFYGVDVNVGPRKTFAERKKELLENLSNDPDSFMGRMRDPKTSKEDKQTYERFLKESIAETIGAEAYERLKGKLPNGVTEETFSRRLANDPSFNNIVTPLINSVYWAVGKGDKETPGLGKKAGEIVAGLIEDKTILTACNLDQMYQNDLQKNKDNPDYKAPRVSPGVAKIQHSYQDKITKAQAELENQKKGPQIKGPKF